MDPGPTVSGIVKECVLRLHRPVYVVLFVVSLLQQRPSGRDDDQSPADLHHGQRNSKKGENVGPNKIRPNQQEKTVYGNAPCQCFSRFRRVLAGQRQKKGAAPKRVHDRKKRTENQEYILRRFQHRSADCPPWNAALEHIT
jgi:hypothetical protein